jgi:microsomal dipeptidase-like Zn-dependent dipeptidase
MPHVVERALHELLSIAAVSAEGLLGAVGCCAASMIADLHNHYPMHLVPDADASLLRLVTTERGRWRLLDQLQALGVGMASRIANYQSFHSGPRSTVPLMRAGGVGVALSVLYSPFDEMDADKRYHHPPSDAYIHSVLRHLEEVEEEIADHHAGEAAVAHDPGELDDALAAGRVALVHCLEGGFHLGLSPEAVERAVGELAEHGLAYITLAHLFWRRIATHANAIPFLPDPVFYFLFPQPPVGLSDLARAAMRAMVRRRVLIDLSHMSERSLDDAFALLDELDPDRTVPVVASHAGYRFGRQEYNLNERTVERIAERDGVIGLILAEHQAADGLRDRRTTTLGQSLEILFRHVDRLREITGSHRHAAIGSDHDGFIKPTLAGLEDARRLGSLETALAHHYGGATAEQIASGNVLRLLRSYWQGGSVR